MNGENGTVEGKIMKGLRKEAKERLEREAKDFGIEPARYMKMWHDTQNAFAQIFGYMPTNKVISSAVRASVDVARAADHCMLYEREHYAAVRIEARFIINSDGTEATSMEILSKEARWPLLQSLLRSIIGNPAIIYR